MQIKNRTRLFNLSEILWLAVLCLAAAVVPCAAQNFRFDAPAVKGSRVTYLDLARKISADADIENEAASYATTFKNPAVRHLFGAAEKALDAPPITLEIADRLETSDDKGGKILWLIFSVAEPEEAICEACLKKILAAFRVSRTRAELIDAADVRTGFEVRFDSARPKLEIAPGREAVLLWNYSYSYLKGDSVSIIAADAAQGGFKVLLDQFEVGRLYRWDCDKWYEERANLRLSKPARAGFRNLEIAVETQGGSGDYDFPKLKASSRFRYVFAWQPNARAYQAIVKPDEKRNALVKRLAPDCRE
jgi:hypothetical protein